jgi:hypothetical protein
MNEDPGGVFPDSERVPCQFRQERLQGSKPGDGVLPCGVSGQPVRDDHLAERAIFSRTAVFRLRLRGRQFAGFGNHADLDAPFLAAPHGGSDALGPVRRENQDLPRALGGETRDPSVQEGAASHREQRQRGVSCETRQAGPVGGAYDESAHASGQSPQKDGRHRLRQNP